MTANLTHCLIASSGAANGMILIVATICRGSTTVNGGKVPSVMASSTRLSRSTRSRSRAKTPLPSACRLTRPVNGAAAETPGPIAASATRCAAISSATSPGSSRATVIRDNPAPAINSRSAADSSRPFFSAVEPNFRLCARMAPSASPTATSPNFIPPPPHYPYAAPGSSRQRSKSRPRLGKPRRSRDRLGRECGQHRCR